MSKDEGAKPSAPATANAPEHLNLKVKSQVNSQISIGWVGGFL